jgi:hypothetical protein
MDADRLERSVRTLWDIEGETGETPRFRVYTLTHSPYNRVSFLT